MEEKEEEEEFALSQHLAAPFLNRLFTYFVVLSVSLSLFVSFFFPLSFFSYFASS